MRTVLCLNGNHTVAEDQFDNHQCADQYIAWRELFYPTSKVQVVFVGIAPPRPHDDGYFPYIYRDPDSNLSNTSLTLRDGIHEAFNNNPKLNARYPELLRHFSEAVSDKKGPFLDAIRDSGVVWIDVIEFAVETKQACRTLASPLYFKRCQNRLVSTGAKSMIFASDSRKHNELADSIRKAHPEITVTVIPDGFWPRGGLNLRIIAKAISKGMDIP